MNPVEYSNHYNTYRWKNPDLGVISHIPDILGLDYIQALGDNEADASEIFNRINMLFGHDMSNHWYFGPWYADEMQHAEFFHSLLPKRTPNQQNTTDLYEVLMGSEFDVWAVLALDEGLTTIEYANLSLQLKGTPLNNFMRYIARDEGRHYQGATFELIRLAKEKGMNRNDLKIFLENKHLEVHTELNKRGLLGKSFVGDQKADFIGNLEDLNIKVVEQICATFGKLI